MKKPWPVVHERKKTVAFVLLIAIVLMLSLSTMHASAAPAGYSLDWWTVDGSGGSGGGVVYSLEGVAGQPDAGLLNGGGYDLFGGFLNGGIWWRQLFLPLVIR